MEGSEVSRPERRAAIVWRSWVLSSSHSSVDEELRLQLSQVHMVEVTAWRVVSKGLGAGGVLLAGGWGLLRMGSSPSMMRGYLHLWHFLG